MTLSFADIVLWETLGTGTLMLIGCGTVANATLRHSGGRGVGWLMCALAWTFGVFAGASIADPSGGHLNPVVTIGFAITGKTAWSDVPAYFLGEFLGGALGAVAAYLVYKLQFDTHDQRGDRLADDVPAVVAHRRPRAEDGAGLAGLVLIFWILHNPTGNAALGYAGVAFVILAIGLGIGGPTMWALNPARDLGPRIVYSLLPIKGKGSSDWAYSWVPIVGPTLGATGAAFLNLAIT